MTPIFNSKLKSLSIYIQCTWARVFTEPIVDKGLCIRSYDRTMVNHFFYTVFQYFDKVTRQKAGFYDPITPNQIGWLTGNYFIDDKKVTWLEARLLYCDRRPTGWFRESDIWHSLKGCNPNNSDYDYIPFTPDVTPDGTDTTDGTNTSATKKSNAWIAWIIPALALLGH